MLTYLNVIALDFNNFKLEISLILYLSVKYSFLFLGFIIIFKTTSFGGGYV